MAKNDGPKAQMQNNSREQGLGSSELQKKHTSIPTISDKATKRVIAPYVRIVRKTRTPEIKIDDPQFSFYLQKKPSVLIRDLSSFLSDSVNLPLLLNETSDVLKNVIKSCGVTLYLIDYAANEIFADRKVKTTERHKARWTIEEGTTVAAYVALKKEYVMVPDILYDSRFPESIGYDNQMVKSVLCVPVITPDGDCIGVIELYRTLFEKPFDSEDLKITIIVMGWMGAAIHQNQERLAVQRQQELNVYLLELAKCFIAGTVPLDKMISEIIKFAKEILGGERSSIYILDKEDDTMADYMDDYIKEDATAPKKTSRVRFNKDRGITGYVARTGLTINALDAYTDPRFNKDVDQKPGCITRSILCMPVMGTGEVLGVVQVINKMNGGRFTTMDQNLFKTFSVYCSLVLSYNQMTTKMIQARHSNNIQLKMLRVQEVPCSHDRIALHKSLQSTIKYNPQEFELFSWYLDIRQFNKMPMLCFQIIMLAFQPTKMNLTELFNFVLVVMKYHRPNPFHNFEYAFNACHCMFVILQRNPNRFTDLERKGLILAALCHSLDHYGCTNSYLYETKDDLAQLYHNLPLENNSFNRTMWIMQKYNIFQDMPAETFKLLEQEMRDAIMATDMATFFKNKDMLKSLIKTNSLHWDNPAHRACIKGIMMVSCGISGQSKAFVVSKRITDDSYAELYNQGDQEKKLGLCPIPGMDRTRSAKLESQIRYLSVVVIPCLDLLKRILPNTSLLYDEALHLRKGWQDIMDVMGRKCWRQADSIIQRIN